MLYDFYAGRLAVSVKFEFLCYLSQEYRTGLDWTLFCRIRNICITNSLDEKLTAATSNPWEIGYIERYMGK